jgi:hypothetical protein
MEKLPLPVLKLNSNVASSILRMPLKLPFVISDGTSGLVFLAGESSSNRHSDLGLCVRPVIETVLDHSIDCRPRGTYKSGHLSLGK